MASLAINVPIILAATPNVIGKILADTQNFSQASLKVKLCTQDDRINKLVSLAN